MKTLGEKAMKKIQNLIAQKSPNKTKPQSSKSTQQFKPSRIVQDGEEQQSPRTKHHNISYTAQKQYSPYNPRQRDQKFLQKRTKILYQEMDKQLNYRVQNTHSFFLNQKHPKPPIYERAKEILQKRQAALEQKRQEKLRQKLLAQEREQLQFLQNQPEKKTVSKQEAGKIAQRLYKQHYSKTNRINQQKIQRLKEDAKNYRVKPQINNNSKQIFTLLAGKSKLQTSVIERFSQYQHEKKYKQKQILKNHKERVYPFKPQISDHSRIMATARKSSGKDKSPSTSRVKHCKSCLFKNQSSLTQRSTSPLKTHYQ